MQGLPVVVGFVYSFELYEHNFAVLVFYYTAKIERIFQSTKSFSVFLLDGEEGRPVGTFQQKTCLSWATARFFAVRK
jgi:hypothetical protein